MRAETAAATSDLDALSWAWGCLAAAAVWALRAEAGYLVVLALALAAAPPAGGWLLGAWMRHAHPMSGAEIGVAMSTVSLAVAAFAAAALVLWHRRRVLAAIIGVGLVSQWPTIAVLGAAMPSRLLASPLAGAATNHPHLPNIAMAAIFGAMLLGPSLLGASTGALVAWVLTGASARKQRRRV